MILNSLSTVGIATQVWAQATRSLTADPATDAGAATLVWTHANRTVSALSGNCITAQTVDHSSIANGGSIDLRPSGTRLREITLVGEATANATYVPTLYNGTTQRAGPAGASGAAIIQTYVGNGTVGPGIQNTGTASGFYNVGGWDWIQ